MAIRFGLIGAGRAGQVHARNVCYRLKNAALTALCDASETALAEAGTAFGVSRLYRDYREACRDPQVDAVIIVTPALLHCEIAVTAASCGKHIFLEKPMALTAEECRQIIAAAERARVKLQLGFMRRFDEGFLRAKELLDSGALGRVMVIKSTGRGPGLPPPWIFDLRKSNGILAEVNSHDFDSVRWLAGSDLVRVYAEADNAKCRERQAEWPDFYDHAVVTLRFANGALGTIDGACPCGYGYDARVEILCEKGLLQIGTVAVPGVTEASLQGQVTQAAVKSWRALFRAAYLAELEHFIDCVQNDRAPRVTGLDGLRAVEAVVAANRAIREQRPVVLS